MQLLSPKILLRLQPCGPSSQHGNEASSGAFLKRAGGAEAVLGPGDMRQPELPHLPLGVLQQVAQTALHRARSTAAEWCRLSLVSREWRAWLQGMPLLQTLTLLCTCL